MISIDSSSSKTGWTYFEDSIYKKSGVIDVDTKECKKKYKGNSDARVKDMCLAIIALLEKYKPDIIVIEKLNISRNMTATRILAKIIGVVYCYSLIHNCFYYEIQATQWRGQIGIQSKGKKTA